MAYSDGEKAIAVELVERYGGLTNDAIAAIRDALGAPSLSKSTLHGWLPRNQKPKPEPVRKLIPNPEKKPAGYLPTAEVQTRAAQTLDDMFEQVARAYLDRALASDVVKDTRGKDAVTTAAIAVDKMRLLRDLPTEIIEVLPTMRRLYDLMQARGLDMADFIHHTVLRLETGLDS